MFLYKHGRYLYMYLLIDQLFFFATGYNFISFWSETCNYKYSMDISPGTEHRTAYVHVKSGTLSTHYKAKYSQTIKQRKITLWWDLTKQCEWIQQRTQVHALLWLAPNRLYTHTRTHTYTQIQTDHSGSKGDVNHKWNTSKWGWQPAH